VTLRLLTYNIKHGGRGREQLLATVIAACAPDVVVLQEARAPEVVERIAQACAMTAWASRRGHSLAFMSRIPVRSHAWHQPRRSRHAFIEVALESGGARVFGVHLSAVHSAWTERRRVRELRALLAAIKEHQSGPHALAGDFNTLAPGELLEIRHLPFRLRPLVWLSGGTIRWRTIQEVLDAGYVDAYRSLHADPGLTFPTRGPHVRLDYVFVPIGYASRLKSCDVIRQEPVAAASDHHPLLAEIDF